MSPIPFRSLRSAAVALVVLATLAGCDSSKPTAPIAGPPLSALVISPDTDTLRVGEFRAFTAQAYDTLNALVAAPLSWRSTDTGVFSVTNSGIVTGRGEGAALLVVQSGGLTDSAVVYVYPDTGWFVQPSSAAVNLNGVFFLADGRTGWVVGDGGRILKTTNAGASWTSQTSNSAFTLHAVWFTSALEGRAVGNARTVLRTANGGTTWLRVSAADSLGENLEDVVFASRDTGWVVGAEGLVARTFDRGATWRITRLPTAFDLKSLSFAGTRDGWAVGEGGVVAGTHDRGLTWFLTPNLTTQTLMAVSRTEVDSAIAVGAVGTVLRTESTPDSVAWALVVPSAGAVNQLNGVHAPGPNLVFAVGYNAGVGGAVLRSDDRGLTWESQASRTPARLNDVFFVDTQRGWAVGDGGVIIHTARGGRR